MTSAAGTQIPTWLTEYLEAWNSHDPARVAGCLTDDVEFVDLGIGESLSGTDAVRAMVAGLVETFSTDYRLEPGGLVADTGGTWAAEWVMVGTNDRPDPVRGVPATGRSYRIQGLSIGRRRDGKISQEHLYWNMADYLTQVGLMSAPEPAVAPA